MLDARAEWDFDVVRYLILLTNYTLTRSSAFLFFLLFGKSELYMLVVYRIIREGTNDRYRKRQIR